MVVSPRFSAGNANITRFSRNKVRGKAAPQAHAPMPYDFRTELIQRPEYKDPGGTQNAFQAS
jgi:hypothetical protein